MGPACLPACLVLTVFCHDTNVRAYRKGGFTAGSIVAFTSANAIDWEYASVIANASWGTPRVHYQPYGPLPPSFKGAPGTFTNGSGTYQFWQKSIWGYGGPSEHDLETLSDNKTLIAVLRMDGDDTCSTGAYEYYHVAYSTDFGKSFTRPAPLKGAGCARPRIKRFSSGPLLMTGGRMCVENVTGLFAWLNLDGMGGLGSSSPGDAWTRHSISYQHNLRWKGDKKYLFTDEVNSTSADDRPRFFDETQAYTSILLTGPRSATIMYQQWAEPKQHNGTTFAIQVEIRPDENEPPPPPPSMMKHDGDEDTTLPTLLKSDDIEAAGTISVLAEARPPLPSLAQLRYQRSEVVTIFQLNSNCSLDRLDPRTDFVAPDLNFSAWADLTEAIGAKGSWAPVKGFCGLLLWHTQTTLPDGSPYNYTVKEAGYPDLLKQYTQIFKSRGLGPGAYYDLDFNWFLHEWRFVVPNASTPRAPGQATVSQAEFEEIMFAQLEELWGSYGDWFEVWLDGGFLPRWADRLQKLLQLQPEAAVFNGCASGGIARALTCITRSPTCWVGSESGLAPDPTWSTGASNDGGNASGQVWCPRTVDTTVQIPNGSFNGMGWAYNQASPIKNLSTLIDTYHQSVGHGGTLEISVDMTSTGGIVPSREKRLREFGAWRARCYGDSNNLAADEGSWEVDLQLDATATTGGAFDRVVLQEDLSYGQRIRRYQVLLLTVDATANDGGTAIRVIANGTAVGSKKIDLLTTPISIVKGMRVLFKVTLASSPPHLSAAIFGASPCAPKQKQK